MAITDEVYELQLIDLEIDRRVKAAKALDDGSEVAGKFKTAKAELNELTGHLKQLRGELKDHELELKALEEKSAKVKDKLFGGRITNPKELGDLSNQQKALERQRARLDEQVLELMGQVDAESSAEAEHTRTLAALKQEYVKVHTRYEKTVGRLKQEVAALLEKRKAARQKVPAAVLQIYDMLRKRYGGEVVVTPREPVCPGCKMAFGSKLWHKVRDGKEVARCGNCSRILHFRG